MHFDLTDLRLFLHVAEAGSITAGAARSGLALASASARVQGMEAQAGVALLERGRRGVEPTPAGISRGDNWLQKERTGDYVPDDYTDARLIHYDDLFTDWERFLRIQIRGRDAPDDGSENR